MAQHTKRIASPRSWPIKRKTTEWVSSPKGGHSRDMSVSVNVALKEILKITKTTKESRYVIFEKGLNVNGNKMRSERSPFGLFDVLTLPETKESYIMLFNNRGKLVTKKLSEKESEVKLSKVIGKKTLGKGKTQLNLMGGMNIIVSKDDYKAGDTVVVSLKDKKPKETLKLEKGALVYLLTGKDISKTAKVKEVESSNLVYESEGEEFKITKEDVVVVGKDKPYITLE